MRTLVTVTPQMYREAIALSLHRHRPGFEVRIAAPETAEEQIRSFQPHLLVRNDTDGLDQQVLDGIPFWVEVRYSDGMDVTISTYGHLREVRDMSMNMLLQALDEASAQLGCA